MPTHYFLGNRLLASSAKPPMWDDTVEMCHSALFVCRVCGEAWGRIIREGYVWTPITRECAKHNLKDSGGSFISPWVSSFAHLPPEVLAYELALRLHRLEL